MFTVKDLKAGMLVEMKDKGYGILLPLKDGTLGICSIIAGRLEVTTTLLRFYPEPGLIEGYSIIRVWGLTKGNPGLLSPKGRKLLYDYSVKEMTIEEIEKALGYSIKIVKKN